MKRFNQVMKYRVAPAMVAAYAYASTSAFASIAATDLDGVKTDILGSITVVTTVGLAILAVALGWDVAFGLAKKYIKKGAK